MRPMLFLIRRTEGISRLLLQMIRDAVRERFRFPFGQVHSVTKDASDKSDWKDICAAWPHKDGRGFNLRFAANPTEGAEVIIRTVRKAGGAQ
jgi:hypothetical protein